MQTVVFGARRTVRSSPLPLQVSLTAAGSVAPALARGAPPCPAPVVGMSLPPVSPPLARLLYRSLLRTSARGKRPECLPMLVRHRL